MDLKGRDPAEIAVALLSRSICAVQVAAVLVDKVGVVSLGWNHCGFNGLGEHAEQAALRRANPKRLGGATLYIAARRRRNGKVVTAKPCPCCQRLVRRVGRVVFRDGGGRWMEW